MKKPDTKSDTFMTLLIFVKFSFKDTFTDFFKEGEGEREKQ